MAQRLLWPDLDWLRPQVMEPTGWKMLVVLPIIESRTKGGLILDEGVRNDSQMAGRFGKVLSLGSHAYEEERFPHGPWCEVGDVVAFETYAGTVFEYEVDKAHVPDEALHPVTGDKVLFKFRILNDDEISGTKADRMKGWV